MTILNDYDLYFFQAPWHLISTNKAFVFVLKKLLSSTYEFEGLFKIIGTIRIRRGKKSHMRTYVKETAYGRRRSGRSMPLSDLFVEYIRPIKLY